MSVTDASYGKFIDQAANNNIVNKIIIMLLTINHRTNAMFKHIQIISGITSGVLPQMGVKFFEGV